MLLRHNERCRHTPKGTNDMKSITLSPTKNSISEIKTWMGDDGEILSLIIEYRDGIFQVFFPESDDEEQQMLEDMWADPEGKSYPEIISEASQDIDLSDYAHEMISLGVSSSRWEVKKGGEDVSSEHRELLESLEEVSEWDLEEFLEDNSWEIDLQYFHVGSVASISE